MTASERYYQRVANKALNCFNTDSTVWIRSAQSKAATQWSWLHSSWCSTWADDKFGFSYDANAKTSDEQHTLDWASYCVCIILDIHAACSTLHTKHTPNCTRPSVFSDRTGVQVPSCTHTNICWGTIRWRGKCRSVSDWLVVFLMKAWEREKKNERERLEREHCLKT